MGENTLDNCGQWTGKRVCVCPTWGAIPRHDDANSGGDMTSDDEWIESWINIPVKVLKLRY